MMYNQQFVVSIKCNGKIMREHGDEVYLPFGTEYSILMKNLSNRKASVKIWVDGENLFDGGSLIVDSNKNTELERFYKTNHKFKFIEKTQEISEYRGDKIDDGIIRVEYTFEKQIYVLTNTFIPDKTYNRVWYDNDSTDARLKYRSSIGGVSNNGSIQNCACDNISESGITVKGSISEQSFSQGVINVLENTSNIIVLHLKGYNKNNEKIQTPIYVRKNLVCETCGKSNNSQNKFCSNCGTALF